MKFSGSQTVFSCKEYDSLQIPIRDFLDDEGNLDLYSELSGKGYFDIDYRAGRLSLRAKGFVGLIPVSDTIAIHVEPRAPIGNLLYMIWRSGLRLAPLEGYVRGYSDRIGSVENVEDLYVSTFVSALRRINAGSILRRYCSKHTMSAKRGRLLIDKTVSHFQSRGIRQHHVFEFHELTANNRENQIIKHTAERILKHFILQPSGHNKDIATTLRALLSALQGVDSNHISPSIVSREAIALIRTLPRSHSFYEAPLWLSYLIAVKAGVSMESVGRTRFESVIIDVANVFERYVRTLCEESVSTYFPGCSVIDGNRHAVPLFTTSSTYNTQPDYYFRRDGTNIAVADAKYKPKLATEDRYALIAFCEALNVNKAAFVAPRFGEEPLTSHQGTTRGGITIHLVKIDLMASDLPLEEDRFKQQLGNLLGLNRPAVDES